MGAILLYGDTLRYPALRHEIPLEIVGSLLFAVRDDASFVLTSSLERRRIADVLPAAEIVTFEDLGFFELLEAEMAEEDAELETVVRALSAWGIEAAVVPGDLPVAVADHLRGAGIAITVDSRAVSARRRVKSAAELDGIRRAQRAAEAGMTVAERLIRGAPRRGELLEMTAEDVRAQMRAACAAAGAPAPPDIMVVSALSGDGHDPGSGPLPADLPIVVDLWPRDERSGCWADMTRTFVAGEVSEDVAVLGGVVREAVDAVRGAARPGISGRELYGAAADVVERAGHPTLRTRRPGETHGFCFSLGHGVGLEVHESPWLGLVAGETLVAGDVIAIEPGIEGLDGLGGVRFEDLLLITEDGCETLTDYAYDLVVVVLFHHAQGLTAGCLAFADALRAEGHTVHTPDLYDGKTFATLAEGMAYADAVGFAHDPRARPAGRRRVAGGDRLRGLLARRDAGADAGPDAPRGPRGTAVARLRPALGIRRSVAAGRPRADPHDGGRRVG